MEAAVASAGIKLASLALAPVIKKLRSKFGGDVTPDEMEDLKYVVRYEIEALIRKVKLDASDEAMQLREKLQAASSELDDLFDIYEYHQIEKQVSAFSSNPINKFKPMFNENFGYLLPKSSSRDRLEKLLKLLERAEKLVQLITSRTDTTQPKADTITQTSSALSCPYFGRENQCKSIIDFLLHDSNANKVPVIAITGIGGSGKSHTAQYICNDDTIKKHFDAIMWVHVTRDFDVVGLTRQMLESIINDGHNQINSLDKLQKILKESVSIGKRFLFVLDDFWCEDRNKWDLVVSPLNAAARNGSKIIITTQIEKIADKLHAEKIKLEELKTEDCWSILKHYVYDDPQKTIHDHELVDVGERIISKVKESPLALRVVGCSLSDKGSVNEWENKLNQDILKVTMDHLLYSYERLPLHLRQCFAYCSLFPKGYKFYIDFHKKEPHLISLWIAQGHIKTTAGLTLEEAGKNYIEELQSRSFFENKSKDYFVIPNLLHGLAENVSLNLCHRVEGHNSMNIPATCIHLSFCTTENFGSSSISVMKAEISKLTNLRTLIILRGPVLENIFKNGERVLPKLTNLRSLYVCPDQLMGALSIDKFKTLRYLHVQYAEKLPKPLAKLYHLTIFILITNRVNSLTNDRKYLEANTLPEGFDNLISLRTLLFFAQNGDELDYLYYNSKWINVGKLKKLQNLMAFHPKKDGSEGMMLLEDLSLCGSLSVLNLENVQSKVEAKKAMLNQKKRLNELIFEWSNTSNDNSNTCEEVLEGLEPQENLEKLEIVRYQGVNFPNWMKSLPRLQTLTLRFCTSLKISPFLPSCRQYLEVSAYNGLMRLSFVGDTGHNLVILYDCQNLLLPSIFEMSCGVCMLTIKECSINDIDLSFLNNLEYLHLVRLPSLQNIINMSPTVTDLTIEDCPKLCSAGNLQRCISLQRLKIKKCPMLLGEEPSLVEDVAGDMSNRLPQAKHIETDEPLLVLELVQQPGFSSIQGLVLFGSNGLFPPRLVEYFHQLSSLRRLVVIDFKTLPNLEKLSSLEKLNISDCPDVEELPILPDSLQSITLRKCPKLKDNYERHDGLHHTISQIPDNRVY